MPDIDAMDASRLDLNLLTALDALLRERQVTRAAATLGLSQPAMSHALKRLRELFGDPLLVRSGQGMALTARAAELQPRVREVLARVPPLLEPEPFVPAHCARTFRLVMTDLVGWLLLPTLVGHLAEVAPRATLRVLPPMEDVPAALETGRVDLALGVHSRPPEGLRQQRLFTDTLVCVVRQGHPSVRGGLSLKTYAGLSHVVVAPRGLPGSAVDEELARRGLRRHVALTVPHFLLAPHVVAGSDAVATLSAHLAARLAPLLSLEVHLPPLPLPGQPISQLWHERTHADPAHRWLREQVREACAGLADASAPPAAGASGPAAGGAASPRRVRRRRL
jgi:DNA-binding transcriptional LysR family regulator